MDITDIIIGALTVIAGIITVFVVPLIKEKLTAVQRQRVMDYVTVAVKAAEQLFPTVDGEKLGRKKLEYVAELLESKGIKFDVDDIYDEVRAKIEAAVEEFCN